MANEIQAPHLRRVGPSVAQTPDVLVWGQSTGAVAATNTWAYPQVNILIPFSRGQIFVPHHMSGLIVTNAAAGANAGSLAQASCQVVTTGGSSTWRNWLASLSSFNLGSAGGTFQIQGFEEIDSLEQPFNPPTATSLTLTHQANIFNNTAGSLTYTMYVYVIYHIRFQQG